MTVRELRSKRRTDRFDVDAPIEVLGIPLEQSRTTNPGCRSLLARLLEGFGREAAGAPWVTQDSWQRHDRSFHR